MLDALEAAKAQGATHALQSGYAVYFPISAAAGYDHCAIYQRLGKWHIEAPGKKSRGPLPTLAVPIGDLIFSLQGRGAREADPPGGPVLRVGSTIVLPAGHRVGMGRLRKDTTVRIDRIENDSEGAPIYGFSWMDERGKARSGWLSQSEALQYVRRGGFSHESPSREIESECRPYLKIERDEKRFRACQAIADRIGPIDSTEKSYEVLRQAVGHELAERFGVMTMDTHLKLRDIAETGAGETDAVMAPKVPTLQAALLSSPTYAIIYHVHPAASERPSDADVEVTKDFAKAFAEVGVPLLDHIIISTGSKKGHYSFAESKPKTLQVE